MTGKGGLIITLLAAAALLLGTVVYGLVTGDVPTYAGEHKQSEVRWRSRESETGYFWSAVGIHGILGIGAVWWARRIQRDGFGRAGDP